MAEIIQKPHVLCLPYPAQSHINTMMLIAKLLHSRGFHVTFVNTEFNHRRLVKSGAIDPTVQIDGFLFETITDGLHTPDMDATQSVPELSDSLTRNCLAPLRQLISRHSEESVGGRIFTCLVRDVGMGFAQEVADELGIPDVSLCTTSACTWMGNFHCDEIIRRGYTPFKDASWFTNGYLDTPIDWIPAMPDIRLKDLLTFIRTTDPNDIMLNYCISSVKRSLKSSAIIFHTFDELEHDVIDAIKCMFTRRPYTVGPLPMIHQCLSESRLDSSESNLWKEEKGCVEWLDSRDPSSVIYVSFGSITVLTHEQLNEFAWGLANSKHPFLWVIRPDLVSGESAVLVPEFIGETKERGLLASWCPQKEVLAHPSVGGFLTHCGWNSTLESIYNGIPMLCWPFFADQQLNCRYICNVWGIGMEIDNDITRVEVEGLVRELMEGDKGKEMRKKAIEWKESARKATEPGGSSYTDFDGLVNDLLVMKRFGINKFPQRGKEGEEG
ncbi:7-deoxyloganetin glucosyltransferase-like isoform X2 [Tasmannia lanceolata]|uniref:7-deoxyloganetin glucosyltransferase-like isoform X2 n=1 Tax=Tasmannia lanceolata TaxID=3420 RepID=UPI004063C9AA